MTDNYFHHTAIQVKDIKESVNFYVSHFNAQVLYEDNSWALLSLNSITKLALVLPTDHPPHIAIVSDLTRYSLNLKEHRDGVVSRYIKDPSGNVIELLDPQTVTSYAS